MCCFALIFVHCYAFSSLKEKKHLIMGRGRWRMPANVPANSIPAVMWTMSGPVYGVLTPPPQPPAPEPELLDQLEQQLGELHTAVIALRSVAQLWRRVGLGAVQLAAEGQTGPEAQSQVVAQLQSQIQAQIQAQTPAQAQGQADNQSEAQQEAEQLDDQQFEQQIEEVLQQLRHNNTENNGEGAQLLDQVEALWRVYRLQQRVRGQLQQLQRMAEVYQADGDEVQQRDSAPMLINPEPQQEQQQVVHQQQQQQQQAQQQQQQAQRPQAPPVDQLQRAPLWRRLLADNLDISLVILLSMVVSPAMHAGQRVLHPTLTPCISLFFFLFPDVRRFFPNVEPKYACCVSCEVELN